MPTTQNDTTTSRLLSINEAAERLNVHRRTIERLKDSGQLAHVKIGRVTRIPIEALIEYGTRNTITSNMTPDEREHSLALVRAALMDGDVK